MALMNRRKRLSCHAWRCLRVDLCYMRREQPLDRAEIIDVPVMYPFINYLTTRAPPPATSFSTSDFEAIEVSPGVVIARAP